LYNHILRLKLGFVALVILTATVFPALNGIAHAAPAREVINFKGDIRNTFSPASCDTSAYNSICPSGTCRCETYEGKVVTGNLLGKVTDPEGNYPAVSIDITVDAGNSVGSMEGACSPIFASAFIVGSKDTQEIDFNGTYCTPLKNVNSHRANSPILGGYGIESSTAGFTGHGTVAGSVGYNTGTILLHFKGPVVQGP
jgi:hypothetical protein